MCKKAPSPEMEKSVIFFCFLHRELCYCMMDGPGRDGEVKGEYDVLLVGASSLAEDACQREGNGPEWKMGIYHSACFCFGWAVFFFATDGVLASREIPISPAVPPVFPLRPALQSFSLPFFSLRREKVEGHGGSVASQTLVQAGFGRGEAYEAEEGDVVNTYSG